MSLKLRKWKEETELFHWIMYEFLEFFGSDEMKKKYNSWKEKDWYMLWRQVYVRNWGLWNPNFTKEEFETVVSNYLEDKEYLETCKIQKNVDESKLKFKWISELKWTWFPILEWGKFRADLKKKVKTTKFPTAYFNKELPIIDMQMWPMIDYSYYENKTSK